MRFFIVLLIAAANTAIAADRPKLILQITVDQLRGDLPTRHYDRLGEGGFRYLWENGVLYRNAHYAHANTETIVGHTTLATGAPTRTNVSNGRRSSGWPANGQHQLWRLAPSAACSS